MSFVLSANILLIFISVTHAIYNGNCTRDDDCSSMMGMRCNGNRCVCDTPWFTPCNSSVCIAEKNINYAGDQCRTHENCMTNAKCNATNKKCECVDDFTDINGLCYKSLNSTCQYSNECWSRECRENRCQCPVGYTVHDDENRCELVLASIYANWTLANQANEFCHDDSSCFNLMAICRNDSIHAEKYCQCPSTHTVDYVNQKCEWIIYDGLSPTIRSLPNTICGKCRVSNAICVDVNEQTTCWCQAGFVKENDRSCKKQQRKYIFPSRSNIQMYQYTFNCSFDKSNGLCACQSGYEFSIENSTCQPIVPRHFDDQPEYGVCTRINSHGDPVQEHGICPIPLLCKAQTDKHVCSCDQDQYFDENKRVCYSYLNRNITNANCPTNSKLIDSQCQCDLPNIYLSVANRTCELNLKNEDFTNCNLSATDHGECVKHFGEYTKFCKRGECRCLSDHSVYQNNKCITLIGVNATNANSCPTNAVIKNGQCQCSPGYRRSQEAHICIRLNIPLSSSTNITPGNANIGLTDDDCQILYPQQNVQVANHTCICKEGSIALNKSCIFQLNYTVAPNPNINHRCPKFASVVSGACQCDPGYKRIDDYTCSMMTQVVYEHNQGTVNITGLTDGICKSLFGNAAEKHSINDYCQCQNSSLAFLSGNKCYFLIDVNQSQPVDSSACPPRSKVNGHMCTCLNYYPMIADRKGCQENSILTFASKTISPTKATCSPSYTNIDCENLFDVGAICHETQCYCDRSKYYVSNKKCKLYSDNIFPGEHELHLYVCESDADCGQDGVECGFIGYNYKVCKCQENYYYDPNEKKCVEGFCDKCSTNEKCQGYECVCEKGYYRDSSSKCVEINKRFNLYDSCNQTYFNQFQANNKEFQCSFECEHIRCQKGYRSKETECVKYDFNERCAHDIDICNRVSSGAVCDLNENKCVCQTGYYQTDAENTCVRGVGLSCNEDTECGEAASCLNDKCQCVADAEEIEIQDYTERHIKRCSKHSSVDQLKSYPIILILMLCIHLFTA